MNTIKAVEFPNKEFSSKTELFKALKKESSNIIELKKVGLRGSDSIKMTPIKFNSEVGKANDFEEGFIYPVINTTKYMDSHNDVHLNGIWDISVQSQKGKVYYIADHDLSIKSVIAYPKDVEVFVKEMSFKSLGADFEGTTQALIFKVAKSAIRLQEAKDIINEKIDIEHSIRMQYVKVSLAVNSEDEDFANELETYNKFIKTIANKEKAEKNGYFWAVEEAKIYKEGSMVLAGSNDITPMLHSEKNTQPPTSIEETEPPTSTQTDRLKNFLLIH